MSTAKKLKPRRGVRQIAMDALEYIAYQSTRTNQLRGIEVETYQAWINERARKAMREIRRLSLGLPVVPKAKKGGAK